MTDPQNTMNIRREGDPAFPVEEKEPSSDPSPEPTTPEPAPTPVPYNEDPKVQDFISRQVAKGVAEEAAKLRQEFSGSAAAIREEIGKKRDENAADTKIPAWFGGNQQQWDDYRGWMDGRLQAIEESAINKTFERAGSQASEAQKRTEEATEYLRSEIASITVDKELNPSGKPIDPAKLFKVAQDNDLVDSKGRWNYRAAARLMNSHSTASHAPKTGDKNLAAATMEGSGTGGGKETAPKAFKTGADFKARRPW